jgi:hypothetical protein
LQKKEFFVVWAKNLVSKTYSFLLPLFLMEEYYLPVESRLCKEVGRGDTANVKMILEKYPDVDVNFEYESGWTPLHRACMLGRTEIVRLLLAHPKIDVNSLKGIVKYTPFVYACSFSKLDCAIALINDPRVDLNKGSSDKIVTVYFAAVSGSPEIIRHWIISGKPMDLGGPVGNPGAHLYEMLLQGGCVQSWVPDILVKFSKYPDEVRRQLRLDSGWFDVQAANLLAPVVFLSDGLLQISRKAKGLPISKKARAFFRIARKLPQELQMILCYRAAGSMRTNIPAKEREAGFRRGL